VSGIGPTIGNPRPGYGIRIRLDSHKAKSLASADYSCPCGHAEDATGYAEVELLAIRYGRHRRDECPIPEVRQEAARQYEALKRSMKKKRK
jgi:hypothetical protein